MENFPEDKKLELTEDGKEGVRMVVFQLKEISNKPLSPDLGEWDIIEKYARKMMGIVATYIEEIAGLKEDTNNERATSISVFRPEDTV